MGRCPLTDSTARPVIAHRGGAGRAPENTLVALAGAALLGADAVELDVRLSRDGEVVVIHDATVDRTTDRSGRVADLRASELLACDAGARFRLGREFPFRGLGHGVPRLADVLDTIVDVPLLIEVKEAEALMPTVRLLEASQAVARAVIAASAWAAVAPARGALLRTGACTREGARLLLRPPARDTLPYQALCTPTHQWRLPLPMRRMIRHARTGGAVTHVWTVNAPDEARRLWALGACGIVTDLPDVIRAARDLPLAK